MPINLSQPDAYFHYWQGALEIAFVFAILDLAFKAIVIYKLLKK